MNLISPIDHWTHDFDLISFVPEARKRNFEGQAETLSLVSNGRKIVGTLSVSTEVDSSNPVVIIDLDKGAQTANHLAQIVGGLKEAFRNTAKTAGLHSVVILTQSSLPDPTLTTLQFS